MRGGLGRFCITLREAESGSLVVSNLPGDLPLTPEELDAFEAWFAWETSVDKYAGYTFFEGIWYACGTVELSYQTPDGHKGTLILWKSNGIYTVQRDIPADQGA